MGYRNKGEKIRAKLRAIYGDLCCYCGIEMIFDGKRKPNSATIEHVVSTYESKNLQKGNDKGDRVLACYKCNHGRNLKVQRSLPREVVRAAQITILQRKIEKIGTRADYPQQKLENMQKTLHFMVQKDKRIKKK